jgi:hypothetical protein
VAMGREDHSNEPENNDPPSSGTQNIRLTTYSSKSLRPMQGPEHKETNKHTQRMIRKNYTLCTENECTFTNKYSITE